MKDKRKQIILSIFGILLLVLVTVGVTYAVFTYTKLGSTENTVTTGTLRFVYTENIGVGAGMKITNALPVSDTVGKTYSTEGQVFDFKVEGTNTSSEAIPYEVTLRQKSDSTLPNNVVKIYLTNMNDNADIEILAPTLYSELEDTPIDVNGEIEKTLYQGIVAGNSNNYIRNFRLRMWIDEKADFSNEQLNNKTFTATVNVYANVRVVTEEEMATQNSTEISTISADEMELTKVENQAYQYELNLPSKVTSTTIDVETTNPKATVEIEKIDSLAYLEESNIRRLATSKTFELSEGDNYFKVTITSENKEVINEYKIKITVPITFVSLTTGQSVTAKDGSKWHVLEDSGETSEMVTLLSDYNLNSNGSYNTSCSRDIDQNPRCSMMAYDPDNTNTYDELDTNNAGYFIKNVYEPLVTAALPGTTNVTIPTVYQILKADGKTFNNSNVSLTNSWLFTTNYYTKTGSTSYNTHVWVIRGDEQKTDIYDAKYTNNYGIRPVITTYKANLVSE